MRLHSLFFDDMVPIDGLVRQAGGPDVSRENSLHSDDGWIIEHVDDGPLHGKFRVYREGMARPVFIGNFGSSFTLADDTDRTVRPSDLMEVAGAKRRRNK